MKYTTYNGKLVTAGGKLALFTPHPIILKDLDSNIYNTIVIGSQLWITKNLEVTQYADGTPINDYNGNQYGLQYDTDGAYIWYNSDSNNKDPYGALYSWSAINNPSDLCYFTDLNNVPQTGWRLCTQNDVSTLVYTLGGVSVAGGEMKEIGTTHWNSPNTGATNSSGFTLVGSGVLSHTGNFGGFKSTGYLWTSTLAAGGVTVWGYEVSQYGAGISTYDYAYKSAFPIRCVKDI